MVFNRLPPFKSILELLSLISTLCVFRFLFPEFSFSAFEVPRFLGIPQRITGSLSIQMLLRIQIRLHLSLFNFQGPARSPLSRTAYILYHTFLRLSICFFAFFRGFFWPALAGPSRQTALLLYQSICALSTLFPRFREEYKSYII